MGKSLLSIPSKVFDVAEAFEALDRALEETPLHEKRGEIARWLGLLIARLMKVPANEVVITAKVDGDRQTRFEVACTGFAGVIVREDGAAEAVRQMVEAARGRYATVLKDVPFEEREGEARCLSDDDLRARARALRGSRGG